MYLPHYAGSIHRMLIYKLNPFPFSVFKNNLVFLYVILVLSDLFM